MILTRRKFTGGAALAAVSPRLTFAATPANVKEMRAIAREAYIYAYPMVDSYRIMYAYHVDKNNPEFKAPWNQISNTARVFTPEDKAVQTPNSDTPYSMVGADLRAEPIVLTIPPIEKDRYFSVQLIDAYTFNFDYLGSRTTGNGGGSFLIAGPRWSGETPKGITRVLNAETEFVLCIYRTQLFNPADLQNVKKIQAGYRVQPLSVFLGLSSQPPAPPVDFIPPLTPAEQKTSLRVFSILNFMLQFCPTVPSEVDLMARFAKIGIGAGLDFDAASLSPEIRQAMEGGIADAWAEFDALKKRIDAGEVTSGELFGTREFLKNNYLYRMAAAVIGIYGNSREEAIYPFYVTDSSGQPLDGNSSYTVRFAPGELPPANAFWSLTMYQMPESLLYANPINRYLINSPMLPQLKRDADGGLTLLIQHDSPGAGRESNWLPAPKGPFFMALRIYWPKPEALDGSWKAPAAERVT
ncbi:DUF1254 domain-containing protein [Aestuariivirga sp.]|uniref:DUF1254 domain-containing protein n=1 Tax=Aestuariivirga sp. TaxID=2650926 RepID=UPI00391D30F8